MQMVEKNKGNTFEVSPYKTVAETTLAQRISLARKIRGWNKSKLAKEVGVSNATISDWESGVIKEIKSSHVFVLGEKLNINTRWLATGQGFPQRNMIHNQQEHDMLELLVGRYPIAVSSLYQRLLGRSRLKTTRTPPPK